MFDVKKLVGASWRLKKKKKKKKTDNQQREGRERDSWWWKKKKKNLQQAETQRESHTTKHHIWSNLPELYWLISEYKPK